MLHLTRFTSPAEFQARAFPFLLAREVEHAVILGLTNLLLIKPDAYPSQPYFVSVQDGAELVAAALMTPPFNLVLSSGAPPAALELIARDVRAFLPETPGVLAPKPVSRQFAEIWARLTGRNFSLKMAERLYRLTRVIPPQGVPGQARRVQARDREILLTWINAFQVEAFGQADPVTVERNVNNMLLLPPDVRGAFVWEDPQPVSLVAYGGPTPHSMRLGPVYTPPDQRGRGYASACTAAVSQAILDSGRAYCTLFTDLQNPTSNKIYQQVGYEPVIDVDEYHFQ